MSYVPFEKVIDKADNNSYKLVIIASKRALELAEGMPKLVDAPPDSKNTTIALQEIAEGRVRLKKSKNS